MMGLDLSDGWIIGLTMLLPLVAAVWVVLTGRSPNLRDGGSVAVGGLLLAHVAGVLGEFRDRAAGLADGENPLGLISTRFAELTPGLQLSFSVEPLGLIFALVAATLWPITTVYAVGYMRGHGEQNQTRFFCCFALAISAAMGIAFAGNLATLFLFYEVLTLSTYPLVTHAGTEKAMRAGRTYLGILMGTSIGLLLLAVLGTQAVAGQNEFTVGGILNAPLQDGSTSTVVLAGLLFLFVLGTGKAAIMPVHRWLPAAMVAPTPVSALLHAVAVVKAGVFTILKVVVYIFGIDLMGTLDLGTPLALLAGFTIVAASVVAMRKDNLKERLAWSTIGQLSYIILGALVATPFAVQGAGLHIAMHAFGKITLFFGAGAILVAAHKTEVSQLDGIGRRMPITMGCFLIGALSITGIPPAGGAWSKVLLARGCMDAGQWILLCCLLVSSLLNVVYLLSIPVRAFFRPEAPPTGDDRGDGPGEHHDHGEAPLACRVAMVATASASILLFLDPSLFFDLVRRLTP